MCSRVTVMPGSTLRTKISYSINKRYFRSLHQRRTTIALLGRSSHSNIFLNFDTSPSSDLWRHTFRKATCEGIPRKLQISCDSVQKVNIYINIYFLRFFRCLVCTSVSVQVRKIFCKYFVTKYVSSCEELLAKLPSWRTTPCRLPATAYLIYSQLPSILETVPPTATWGRAIAWWLQLAGTCEFDAEPSGSIKCGTFFD
jgi:hypothetical protein